MADVPFHSPRLARRMALATRAAQALVLALVLVWVFGYLGGVGVRPRGDFASNDTSPVFNWHPICMALAFPVLMAEAVMSFRAPLASRMERPQRKHLHWVLHTAAVTFMVLGVVAAVRSHTLKLPTPIPNLYSVHSYLGVLTSSAAVLQYAAGFVAFLAPKLALSQRRAMAPVHMFAGRAVFVLGLTTMAAGLQEKATFMQAFAKAPVYGPSMVLPALTALLLVAVGCGVMYTHALPAGGVVSLQPAPEDEEEAAGLMGG